MKKTNISAAVGHNKALSRLAIGSALTGTLAVMLVVMPGQAAAANECGVAPLTPGTVTCTPVGNPYPNGIAYIAPPADLTIVLQDGVRVNTNGAANTGVLAASANALTVNGAPNALITTTGVNADGINVSTVRTATVSTGAITTTGANADGVVATGGTGATVTTGGTVSTAGATSNGVEASSTTGPVIVTVNNVTTTGNGSRAVVATATAGAATVNVNGALRTTGTTADVLTVNSGTNGIVNVGAAGSFAATQGNFITLNSTGTSTLNNAGTIGNNLGGFALVATGGPITINNSGNLSTDFVLTAGADRLNNTGTLTVGPNPDFGAGVDVLNNSGTILVGSGATATVSPVFVGLESTINSGLIDLRNGRVGDTLTLPGTYMGQNGTLGLDVQFGSTTSDQLIIGGAATGTTIVAINQLGTTPVFNAGTVLVRTGAGSDANAFNLAGGSLDAGFVRYEVVFNNADNTFLLTGAPSDAAFRTLNYVEGIRNIWLKSADAVSGQMRARRDALWSQGGGEPAGRMWVQMHGSTETRSGFRDFNAFGQSRNVNTGFKQDYFGGQAGLDISGGSGERGGFAFGVTGGYINSSMNFGRSPDSLNFDVANVGAYAAYSSGNIFFNALGKYDFYWADANAASANFQQDFKGGVYGLRGEVGIRLGDDGFFIEPAASISYVKNDFDQLRPLGTTVDFDADDGLRGRAGGRIGGEFTMGGAVMAVYAGANYIHEFKGRDDVTFTGGGQNLAFTNNRLRDYGEAIFGVTIAQTQGISGFIEGNYIRTFSSPDSNRGIQGAGGRAGIRFKF